MRKLKKDGVFNKVHTLVGDERSFVQLTATPHLITTLKAKS